MSSTVWVVRDLFDDSIAHYFDSFHAAVYGAAVLTSVTMIKALQPDSEHTPVAGLDLMHQLQNVLLDVTFTDPNDVRYLRWLVRFTEAKAAVMINIPGLSNYPVNYAVDPIRLKTVSDMRLQHPGCTSREPLTW